MDSLTLKSPAKLNLHLRILGKRRDGYHSLLSLFHRISLADALSLKKRKRGFVLKTNHPKLPTDERNIVTKAYRLLQKEFPNLEGVSVRLTKKIPMEAGLGGGSSNAASFLLGMKRLYGLKISQKRLLVLGKRLGADVPFFLENHPQALVTGIGEKVQKLPNRARHWFLLLVSKKGLSTKKVYQNHRLSRKVPSLTKEKRIVRILSSLLDEKRYLEASAIGRNDLGSSAVHLRPSIQKSIVKLRSLGAPNVGLTGSGPTIFAMFSHRREAEKVSRKLRKNPVLVKSFICCSI